MPKKKKGTSKKVDPVLRIFCEGEKTEPQYLRGFINQFFSKHRRILVVEKTDKNTPLELVQVAIDSKRYGSEDDVVWVVYDRESVHKYSHEKHAEARKLADDNGINIAFSNVCFEYWILLHFIDTSACYQSCANLLSESKLKAELKKIGINNYEKGLATLFDSIKDNLQLAIERAEKIIANHKKTAEVGKEAPHFLNPYVDFHHLLIDMDNFINKKPSVRS